MTILQGRSDLANAKVAGLDKDFDLDASKYSLVASILLVGYLLFQLPAMLLMRKVGPPVEVRAVVNIVLSYG